MCFLVGLMLLASAGTAEARPNTMAPTMAVVADTDRAVGAVEACAHRLESVRPQTVERELPAQADLAYSIDEPCFYQAQSHCTGTPCFAVPGSAEANLTVFSGLLDTLSTPNQRRDPGHIAEIVPPPPKG
ncbi:MAG: hypothetical protein AAFX39_09110 [Pseudomonadota bacterium]